tara:strand:+ start:2346 stop:2912 length:567 start_codon:yes stop_codon:yes gene_type:complete
MHCQPGQPDKNIRILRLKTGEQVISRIRNSNKEKLFLDRPMKISTMVMRNPDEPIGREYVYMNNWVEFSLDNHIAIPKSIIYAILPPNKETLKAYAVHKEMEDKENSSSLQPNHETDIDDEDPLPFNEMVSNIVEDIINSHFGIDVSIEGIDDEEEIWDENTIDKNRKNYGNDLNDWSPYLDDYFDNH